MNAARFRNIIWTCVLALIIYAVIYLFLVAYSDTQHWVDALATLVPVAVAIPAAMLAGAFTLRTSHLHALRDLYQRLVATTQMVIQYTHLTSPNQDDFSKVHAALSESIDEIRLYFHNIPDPTSPIGLYPFENLKDMSRIIEWIGYGDHLRAVEERLDARKCIVKLWRELQHSIVNEIGSTRELPVQPVSKYLHDGRSIADYLIAGELIDSDLKHSTLASRPR